MSSGSSTCTCSPCLALDDELDEAADPRCDDRDSDRVRLRHDSWKAFVAPRWHDERGCGDEALVDLASLDLAEECETGQVAVLRSQLGTALFDSTREQERRRPGGERSVPAFEQDVDTLLGRQPRQREKVPTGSAWRQVLVSNGVVLDLDLGRRPAGVDVLLTFVSRHDDDAVDVSVPRAESVVESVHHGDGYGRETGVAIAAVPDGRQRETSEALLAGFLVTQERSRGAKRAEVVQGVDNAYAATVSGPEDGGTEEREGVVDVDDVRSAALDRPLHDLLAGARPDNPAGQRRPLPRRPLLDVVALQLDVVNMAPVFPEQADLVVDDLVLSALLLRPIATVDYEYS